MPDLTIWDRLAILEGACAHEWPEWAWDVGDPLKDGSGNPVRTESGDYECLSTYECRVCGYRANVREALSPGYTGVLNRRCPSARTKITALPLVGDGRNEERFNSLDVLAGLCDRLGLGWDLHSRGPGYNEKSSAVTWRGDSCFIGGMDRDPRIPFAYAILKAYPAGVDEIPQEGREGVEE